MPGNPDVHVLQVRRFGKSGVVAQAWPEWWTKSFPMAQSWRAIGRPTRLGVRSIRRPPFRSGRKLLLPVIPVLHHGGCPLSGTRCQSVDGRNGARIGRCGLYDCIRVARHRSMAARRSRTRAVSVSTRTHDNASFRAGLNGCKACSSSSSWSDIMSSSGPAPNCPRAFS